LRRTHTWQIRTKVGSATAGGGPTHTGRYHTDGVFIVDTRNADRVQVFGLNQAPVVEQATDEGSIVHTPVHGDLMVEPIRRRMMRTTRRGSINGLLNDADEDMMEAWIAGDSSIKYRLIFGKVNWPTVIGDYNPTDVFYPSNAEPEAWPNQVLITLNWWQRRRDF
jgi:hypothetical protein